ncbi:chitosanase [Motilimonas cestriensis]|uniref:Chitosanase n=1 Tax=Motilimonas cestriensis TaxID=2742685 RepID=A0ABS8W9L8_9GAMM|nr:chitosanase [Motilimonas cestriensis]MCE2594908.1 chitosanase [Motilimonas cestriensis]
MSLHYNPHKPPTQASPQPVAVANNANKLANQEVIERIWRIINVFETGKTSGNYHALVVMQDGKGNTRQITYGRSQTTEQGKLIDLIRLYCTNQGRYKTELAPYLNKIKRQPLADNNHFKQLLIQAGQHDPIMQQSQDQFFSQHYWQPAYHWAQQQGFVCPLSWLVIYDSYIHSGHIMAFLRKRFAAKTPRHQGNEQQWISQYTQTRHHWLSNHSKPLLRNTRYRTQCLLNQIELNNWQLDQLPIIAHGVAVS